MGSSRNRRKVRRELQSVGMWPPPQVPPATAVVQANAAPASSESLLGRGAKRLWGIFSAAVLLFGVFSTFYPWLSIEDGVFMNPRQPFEVVFPITNSGWLSATKLSGGCTENFRLESAEIHDSRSENNTIGVNRLASSLPHLHKAFLPCSSGIIGFDNAAVPGSTCDLTIRYGLLGLPIHMPQRFHLVLFRDADGHYHWFQQG